MFRSIIRWWAQTLEARGCLNEAKSYYNKSKDYLSLVRVLCCLGNEKEAELLCHECGDRAACYHLACHLENKGSVDQAIRLFTRAKAYSSAIRLCKGCNQNDHLFTLSQLGSVDDMLEAAKHLETFADYTDKAVILYNKTGQINRAVELAIETCQFSALQNVITSMDNRLDPILLKKCAQFFIQNNQYDRAVELLAIGQQYSEALTLCGEYNVTITENFAEMLTPQSDKVDHSEKLTILSELGELCTVQGQYYLACKKFTQAGNLIGAMKSLLRSGDTEKIIFFTNVSKHNEIYVMAANYLQTLDDWKSNENIMRTIVQFYTKGHAPESLASFYEACAQAEVDECGNYEKATGALTEAYKCLMKALNSDNIGNALEDRLQRRLVQIKNKATVCKEFMEIESLFSDNAMEAIQRCQILLEGIKPGDILQPGDIYSIMIREFVAQEKFKVAMECLDEMRKRLGDNQIIARYLDRDILEKIHEAIQIPNYETSFHNIDCESKVVHISESPVCEEFEIDTYSSETIDENW